MQNYRKKIAVVTFLIMMFNMFLTAVSPYANADEVSSYSLETNVDLMVNGKLVSTDSVVELTVGDKVEFKVTYNANGQGDRVQEGDEMTFKLPQVFSHLDIKYPENHFKDIKKEVHGEETWVTLICGKDIDTAIGGYISIEATVNQVEVEEEKTIVIEINGQVIKVDTTIKPGDAVDRLFYKDIVGEPGEKPEYTLQPNEDGSIVGREITYSIAVNEKYAPMTGVVLKDTIPMGMSLVDGSIAIERYINGSRVDVTSQMGINYEGGIISINLGDINQKHVVTYKLRVDRELESYINMAVMDSNSHEAKEDSVTLRPTEDEKDDNNIVKVINGKSDLLPNNNGSYVGNKVSYMVEINGKKEEKTNVLFVDSIPEGMELVVDSVKIYSEIRGIKTDVTENFKDVIKASAEKLSIDFGSVSNKYIVMYETRIIEFKESYVNDSKLTWNGTESETSTAIATPTKLTPGKRGAVDKLVGSNQNGTVDPNENGNIIGGYFTYTVHVNDELKEKTNVVLEDRMPLGMEVMNNQVTIYKDAGGRYVNVTETFKDRITVDNRADGHQWVKVIFGDLSSNDRYKVQYKGKVVEAVESNRYENDVTLTWDEGQAKDSCIVDVRQPQKGKETLKKTVDGNNEQVEVIPNPDTGKLEDKEYTLLINEKLEDKKNTVLTDVIPEGMRLKTDSVSIKKHMGGNTYKDVTNEFKDRTEASDNLLTINFGDISDRYKVTYKVEIVEARVEGYKNTAKLDYDINGVSKSEEDSALVIPILPDKTQKPEDTVISKGTTEQGMTVSQIGDKVQYEIKVNEDKRNLNEVVIGDIVPQGMSFLQEDFQVIMSGDYGDPRDITGELKRVEENPGVGEYVLTKKNLIINLGNIDSMYTIHYKTIVDEVKNLYENKAIFSSTEIVKTAVSQVDYVISTGGLNATKEANKSVLMQSENQEVIYTIKVWNSFLLPEKAIKISDSLDSRVKFVEVYSNEAFSVSYDAATHTVTAENNVNLSPVERENAYEIKIKVCFEQVKAGETVRNIAKVNGTNTAPVEVKKGYKFKAVKVDGDDETMKLSRAKFQLLDEDKKILKELVSDDRGVIESDIETTGTYYLREIMAPQGYKLLMEDVKFEVTEAQAGEAINIGNMKNYKMGPVEDGTDEDNTGVIPPIEEAPGDEGLEEKPSVEDETDKDNSDKDNSVIKQELPQAGGKSGSSAILLGFMAVIAGLALRKKV